MDEASCMEGKWQAEAKDRWDVWAGIERSEHSSHVNAHLPTSFVLITVFFERLWVTVGRTGRQSYKIQNGRCKRLHLWRQIVYRDMGDLESRVEKADYLWWSMIYCTHHSKNHSFHPLLDGPITSPLPYSQKRALQIFSEPSQAFCLDLGERIWTGNFQLWTKSMCECCNLYSVGS